MTIVERVAAAIAASRTGSTADWHAYRDDAEKLISMYGDCLESRRDAAAAAVTKKA